ncbi:MAG TPA: class 1 fructose-bisphosphatase [Nitrospiraceae bacterium]|nr:class 1 fructose-bisphosphatase [Nitrospiraceae bacterium]
MPVSSMTLANHLLQQQTLHPRLTNDLSQVIRHIALTGKVIGRELSEAAIHGALGLTGETNVQGEAVQKLDERANELFVQTFEGQGGVVRAIVSEEMEKPCKVGGHAGDRPGEHVLFLDPLDGSSNLDANMTVGSIFSIHRVQGHVQPDVEAGLLKRGRDQVAAGYVLYGPATVFVYTCGAGVYQFTLDRGIGEFVLSGSRLKMPARGKVYSANESNYAKWPRGVQRFVEYLRDKDAATGRPYASRYSGCLVADVHRFLTGGGVYLYPGEISKPEGKLRLMYEAAPLGFIIEQAGGLASTGTERIGDILPTAVHQRIPLIIGSHEDVSRAEEFIQERR